MAKTRKTSASTIKRVRSRPRGLPKSRSPRLMHDLGTELYQLTGDFLREMGVSRNAREKMLDASRSQRKRRKPSRVLIHKLQALSDMLSFWRSDKRYTGTDGTPRVLSIRGKGATLETLARKFLPDTPLPEVLRVICMQGEVQQHKKDEKVVLAGSSVLLHERNIEEGLASFVTRVRALAANCLYNLAQPPGVKGKGWFDRQVTGQLSEKAFHQYAFEVRPQLQDLCNHVESGLQLPTNRERGKKGKAPCGLALFLFREDGKLY